MCELSSNACELPHVEYRKALEIVRDIAELKGVTYSRRCKMIVTRINKEIGGKIKLCPYCACADTYYINGTIVCANCAKILQ